ncbi:MAG: SAM-dependent methyltransferase, partial [Eubacterium sp.]|nr:SAM-dependent methyltransferase [Candidatus Colimonas fimequi]
MRNIQVTEYCRHIMELQVEEGDVCIDATVGNGHDTVHLAKLVGETGTVHGFDIQQAAIDATMQRVQE